MGVDGKLHNYLLDFKIWNDNDSFSYLEVKGYEQEKDKLKWKTVKDKGYDLKIWFLEDLENEEKNLME